MILKIKPVYSWLDNNETLKKKIRDVRVTAGWAPGGRPARNRRAGDQRVRARAREALEGRPPAWPRSDERSSLHRKRLPAAASTATPAAEVPSKPSYGAKCTASAAALRERPLTAPRVRCARPSPPPASAPWRPQPRPCPPPERHACSFKFFVFFLHKVFYSACLWDSIIIYWWFRPFYWWVVLHCKNKPQIF